MQSWPVQDAKARPSLKELLLSNQARTNLVVPVRGRSHRRAPAVLR